ncbi:DUF533 domain-containing protein [Pseudorhodobacter ferrugineus]|uniref:DUF533 domain-containing protein n=1 Tax=Pseudorhodobacter ferrugineus TaxID=77008 RepID=UPI0003B5A7AC|nr:DUF533 domain-containing protein [Pseudorhodobacter ferrugineus]
MSLVSTLAKVAIGVAIAKGVSHMSRTETDSAGRSHAPLPKQSGGLADMMGDLLGNGSSTKTSSAAGRASGGLGGLVEQLSTQSGAKRPTNNRTSPPSGLDDLLGGLAGGAGGLGGLLGGLTGTSRNTAGGTGGGLGDMLGGLLGGAAGSAAAGAAAGGGIGGLGGMLTDIMAGKQPTAAPNAQQEVAAALMLKAMVQAAKSDGKLDQTEKQKLMDSLGEATPAEIAFVNDLLAQPVDINALVDAVPRGLEEQVYLMSLMAIDLDAQAEAQYLHDLATALGLNQNLVNQIHDQAGAQRLYS